MVRHFPILKNSESELSVDPRNGRQTNTTRSGNSGVHFGQVRRVSGVNMDKS